MNDLQTFLARIDPPSTPCLVVRRAALLRNLQMMQKFCSDAGVRLRSHGKMHKSSTVGRLQMEFGAVGVCCQTVGEAESFVAGGVRDVLVSAPVPPWGAPRLAALARTGARVSIVADDARQVRLLDAAAHEAGSMLHILVDVDLGHHRTGCSPEDAPAVARCIADASHLTFDGLQAYLGHLQHEADLERRRSTNAEATRRLGRLVSDLARGGLAPSVVSGGGTGTFAYDLASGIFNEIQAGSYAFMDAEYDLCGAPDGGAWPFQPALFVAASVISARHKTHVTIDAGLKAVSVDGPPPRVVAGAPGGSIWRSMGDEHGAIMHPDLSPAIDEARDRIEQSRSIDDVDADAAVPWPCDNPAAGEIVWLQPGHCDPTINLYDAFLVAEEDGSLERWPIDARRVTAPVLDVSEKQLEGQE